MQVESLHIYPVKSIGAIDLTRADVAADGLAGDRRYMLVDEKDRFITQRQFPRMALIAARPADDSGFMLSAPDLPDLFLPPVLDQGDQSPVTIWNDTVTGRFASQEVNDWFSAALGIGCRLVGMVVGERRPLKNGRGRSGDTVTFADGGPLLLTATSSLDDLNRRLPQAVTMTRFRPNLVVATERPYVEDDWRRVAVGECEFEVGWSCSRCVLTTVDPNRGVRDPNRQPLATLKGYRDSDDGPLFGQNLIPRRLGRIAVGDPVQIME